MKKIFCICMLVMCSTINADVFIINNKAVEFDIEKYKSKQNFNFICIDNYKLFSYTEPSEPNAIIIFPLYIYDFKTLELIPASC